MKRLFSLFLVLALLLGASPARAAQPSIESLQAQINQLLALIGQLQASAAASVSGATGTSTASTTPPGGGTATTSPCLVLTTTMRVGSTDANSAGEVTKLQNFFRQAGYAITDAPGQFQTSTYIAFRSFIADYRANVTASSGTSSLVRDRIRRVSCGLTTPVVQITKGSAWFAPFSSVNVSTPNRQLGAFRVDVRDEPMSLGSIRLRLSVSGPGKDLSGISRIAVHGDSQKLGEILPSFAEGIRSAEVIVPINKIIARDRYTFSKEQFQVRADLSTQFANGQTVLLETNPALDWDAVTPFLSRVFTFNQGNISFSQKVTGGRNLPKVAIRVPSGGKTVARDAVLAIDWTSSNFGTLMLGATLTPRSGATSSVALFGPIPPASPAQSVRIPKTLPDGLYTLSLFSVGVTDAPVSASTTIIVSGGPFIPGTTTPGTTTPPTTGTTTPPVTGTTTPPVATTTPARLSFSAGTIASAPLVAGSARTVFASYFLDATQSGEDVRVSSLPLSLSVSSGAVATALTNCFAQDGAVRVNNGSNTLNPTSAGNQTLILDSGLLVVKGTVKTVQFGCAVSGTAIGTYAWGIPVGGSASAVGVTTGNSAQVTSTASLGTNLSVVSSSVSASLDVSTPPFSIVLGGATNVPVGAIKFRATGEGFALNRVGLRLTSGSPSDLVQVSLWNGAVQVGSAVFTGSSLNATATLVQAVTLPVNADVVLTVKADIATIGSSQPGTEGGMVSLAMNDGVNTTATGLSSGAIKNVTGFVQFNPFRMFRTVPTVTYSTTPGTLVNGTNDLLQLVISASSQGDIQLRQVGFFMSTTSAVVTNLTLVGPNGSVGSVSSGFGLSRVKFDGANTQDRFIAPGQSKTYTLRGSVALVGSSTASVVVAAAGEDRFNPLSGLGTVATHEAVQSAFIWSPNTIGTSALTDSNWANSKNVLGCFQFPPNFNNNDCASRTLVR